MLLRYFSVYYGIAPKILHTSKRKLHLKHTVMRFLSVWLFTYHEWFFPPLCIAKALWDGFESTTSDRPTWFSIQDQPTSRWLQSCALAWSTVIFLDTSVTCFPSRFFFFLKPGNIHPACCESPSTTQGCRVLGICCISKKKKNGKKSQEPLFAPVEKTKWRAASKPWFCSVHIHTLTQTIQNRTLGWGLWLSGLSRPISHSAPYRMLYLRRAFDLLRLGALTRNYASLPLSSHSVLVAVGPSPPSSPLIGWRFNLMTCRLHQWDFFLSPTPLVTLLQAFHSFSFFFPPPSDRLT